MLAVSQMKLVRGLSMNNERKRLEKLYDSILTNEQKIKVADENRAGYIELDWIKEQIGKYYKDNKQSIKDNFNDAVSTAIDRITIVTEDGTINLSDLEIKPSNIEKQNSRYRDHIYWYRIMFNDKIKLQERYKDAVGIHIMPYRLDYDDICGAVCSNKLYEGCYPSEIKHNNVLFTDYDNTTANYHKIVNGIYQIVIQSNNKNGSYGPGWQSVKPKVIKKDWYYPKINISDVECGNDMCDLICKALREWIKGEIIKD